MSELAKQLITFVTDNYTKVRIAEISLFSERDVVDVSSYLERQGWNINNFGSEFTVGVSFMLSGTKITFSCQKYAQ